MTEHDTVSKCINDNKLFLLPDLVIYENKQGVVPINDVCLVSHDDYIQ